ncbi:MAG: hypothetical protein H6728_16390 [Myxococcales bacterium]|nr:hypothetical protein [Myxococcales bacterium]
MGKYQNKGKVQLFSLRGEISQVGKYQNKGKTIMLTYNDNDGGGWDDGGGWEAVEAAGDGGWDGIAVVVVVTGSLLC